MTDTNGELTAHDPVAFLDKLLKSEAASSFNEDWIINQFRDVVGGPNAELDRLLFGRLDDTISLVPLAPSRKNRSPSVQATRRLPGSDNSAILTVEPLRADVKQRAGVSKFLWKTYYKARSLEDVAQQVEDAYHEACRLGAVLSSNKQIQAAKLSGKRLENDKRPKIELTTEEHVTTEQAIDALADDPNLYQRAGVLVHVVRGPKKKPDKIKRAPNSLRIEAAESVALIRNKLSAVAVFVKRSEDGLESVNTPRTVAEAVIASAEWPKIRQLEGVTSFPVIRPDGTVLTEPGYDQTTGLFYEPAGEVAPVLESPTLDDARRARDELLEVVCDFPFSRPEHRAAWLAFLLTPLARPAFDGPSPLFLIDANTPGSGKGLLADATSWILTGENMTRTSAPAESRDDEFRKLITSIAADGDSIILFDNVAGTLRSASFDACLTGTRWKDRLLGVNKTVTLDLGVTWCATGNNMTLGADTARRALHIRLESPLENPEDREGFKHPNLKEWIIGNRPRLLAAALTILRAYFVAGRPNPGLKTWGSFEGWSDLVRRSIVLVEAPDPAAAREEFMKRANTDGDALRRLILNWRQLDPADKGITSAKIVEHMNEPLCAEVREAIVELCRSKGKDPLETSKLGAMLKKYRGRVVAGHAIDNRMGHGGNIVWFLAESGST